MRCVLYVLAIGIVSVITGCGATSGPETAMVAGTVYLDGKPAAEVDVNFINGKFSAFGRTNQDGRFELVAAAAVGENKVYFSKVTGTSFDLNPAEGIDEGQLMAMRDPGVHAARLPKQLIPEKYSDPIKTTISFMVPARGTEEAEFQLQSH